MSLDPYLRDERPQRLLVVAAHPADADRALAGSVAAWVGQGTVAWLVCCTSGDAGSDDAAEAVVADGARIDPLELALSREAEQRAAAAIVGYEEVVFLHRPDGALANDLALREQLVRIIRTLRPDAVASSDPHVLIHAHGRINHVDHRAAGAAAIDAVYPAAASVLSFPHQLKSEELAPHRVTRLYLFEPERRDVEVDVSDSLVQKRQALGAHVSQAMPAAENTESYAVIDLA
jgi:LmbE family N-acetylglucosaminyl deacetylase